MAKKSYAADIKKLVPLLGGRKNISSAMHCVSRMRLVMHDINLVDDKKIAQMQLVKGTIKLQNNQYHIIIGTQIAEVFQEFAKQTGIKEVSKEKLKQDAAGNGNWLQKLMQHFSEIFIPLIPALVAGGLILAFRNILETDFNGYKIVERSAWFNGLYEFLWIPAQAVFWYLPVVISWSIFKKMNGSPVMGIIIGLTLLLPPLINIYDQAGSQLTWIWNKDLSTFGFDFGAYSFPWKLSYTAQVIPAIGVAFTGVYIERLTKNILPTVIHQIFVPLITILGAYTLGMVIIGPVGSIIGTGISFAFKWALTQEVAKYFFGPILGLFYAPLVVTGLHHMLNAIMIQNGATIGGTVIFPILAISNIAQGAGALSFMLSHKTEKMKQTGISATTSAWLGVTEPAMYGINLRYVAPFIAAITGSSMGALLIILSGTSASGIGNGAWLGVLSMQANTKIAGVSTWAGTGFLWFLIASALATVMTFTLTPIISKMPKFAKIISQVGVN